MSSCCNTGHIHNQLSYQIQPDHCVVFNGAKVPKTKTSPGRNILRKTLLTHKLLTICTVSTQYIPLLT